MGTITPQQTTDRPVLQQEPTATFATRTDSVGDLSTAASLAPSSKSDTHVDEVEYHAALARCADLCAERKRLLEIKAHVMRTIAKFAPILEDTDSDHDEDHAADRFEQSEDGVCEEASFRQAKVNPTWADYQEVLAHQEELEEENEMLEEALGSVAGISAGISMKSYELSDHLQEVLQEATLPREARSMDDIENDETDRKLLRPSDCWHVVSNVPLALNKLELDGLKTASGRGLASEASSSTATPRSDGVSESRIASARSVKSAGWCEA